MAHYETKAYPMIPLLEHELIKKYFEFNDDGHEIATRVLQAMSEPIKTGELFIAIQFDGTLPMDALGPASENSCFYPLHPHALRLPDSHQPRREKECDCNPEHELKCSLLPRNQPKPDPVEETNTRVELVKEIARHAQNGDWLSFEIALDHLSRELVGLARTERG